MTKNELHWSCQCRIVNTNHQKKKKLLTLLTPLGLTLFICFFKKRQRLIREESLVINSNGLH